MTRTSTLEIETRHHSPTAAPTPEAALMPRRVLIVEDNDLARRQLHQLLQQDPHLQVESTNDGHRALKELSEHSYSIVITDLRMPTLDGMELIKEVQHRG